MNTETNISKSVYYNDMNRNHKKGILALKEEYENEMENLLQQHKSLNPQSYHRKRVQGQYESLAKVVKDLEELLK